MRSLINTRIGLTALLLVLLAGCATPWERRSDGVYHERSTRSSASVIYVDPLVYPYWSLDYFYFNRHYYPYSVVIQRYDPWYFPFPGWYYGYRPGPGVHLHPGYRSYYPWQRHAHYAHYRPWWVDNRFAFGYRHERNLPRIRQLDSRLHELRTSRSLTIRAQRPDRRTILVPASSPVLPATARRPAGPDRQAVRSNQHERAAPTATRPGRTHHERVTERLQRAPRTPTRDAPPTRSQTPAQHQRDGIELPRRLRTAPTTPRAPPPDRVAEPPRVAPPPASSRVQRSQAPIEAGARARTAPPTGQRVTPPPVERRASPPAAPPPVRAPVRERPAPPPVRLPERQTPRSTPSRTRGNDRDR